MTRRRAETLLLRRVVNNGAATNSRVYFRLRQGRIQDFQGDYLVTSTSRRLEGSRRKNWWGCAGRSSCDAALYELYQYSSTWSDYLVHASQKAWLERSASLLLDEGRLLPFGGCLVTGAGPLLPPNLKVVHTCVPKYPQEQVESHLHTTLPHAWVLGGIQGRGTPLAAALLPERFQNHSCGLDPQKGRD